MRHRRGIDLTGGNNDNMPPKPTVIFVPQRDHSATWADLPQWVCRRGAMLALQARRNAG